MKQCGPQVVLRPTEVKGALRLEALEIKLGRELDHTSRRHECWRPAEFTNCSAQSPAGRRVHAAPQVLNRTNACLLIRLIVREVRGNVPRHRRVDVVELRVVKGIEHFESELQTPVLLSTQREILED